MKTVDLSGLPDAMNTIANAIEKDISQYVNEITLSVVAALGKDTPVDTGLARSNWWVSLGWPVYTTRGAFSPLPSRWRPPYADPGSNKSETRNQAGLVWSSAAAVRPRKPDETVYISNNLPYIEPLNAGHSPQSAAGWIDRAVSRGSARAIRDFNFPNLRRL